MADSKISALPASTVPLAGTEVLPIVQSSATKQVSVANLTAGRAVATGALTVTGDATLSTGNIVQGTAAKGINFTANTPAAGKTSQLLNWYEEGTWTPVCARSTGGAIVATYTTQTGKYTRIGNLVTVSAYIDVASITSQGSAESTVLGLPFSPVDNAVWNGAVSRNTAFLVDIATTCSEWSDGRVLFHAPLNTLAFLSNGWTTGVVSFTLTYRV